MKSTGLGRRTGIGRADVGRGGYFRRPAALHHLRGTLDSVSGRAELTSYRYGGGMTQSMVQPALGMDLDIQAIERQLLASQDSNELLVQGTAGAGKSTLLLHLAGCWQEAGLVDEVFLFSYADRAWTSRQIIREIQKVLLDRAEQASAETMPAAAQLEQIAQPLRTTRHLLILDGAESITADPSAVPHALSEAERQELKTLLARLRGGRTLVLIGSRERAAWLADGDAGPGIYPLAGLDPQAVEALVERILSGHDEPGPAVRSSLLLLAPFTAVIHTGPMLDRYTELLQQDEAVRAVGPVDLAAALGQAVDAGIAAPHPEFGYLIQVQPALSGFLRRRLRDQPALRSAADQAHYQIYSELGAKLNGMLISPDSPQQRAAGHAATRAEYANLAAALAHGLRTGQPILAVAEPLADYLAQAQLHDGRRMLLDEAIAACPQRDGGTGRSELVTLHDLAGRTAVDQHRLDDARKQFEAVLRLAGDRDNLDRATGAHHQLGLIAQHQRRYGQAEASYHRALSIKLQLGDQLGAADTYHQLGILAQDRRRYAEAEASYQSALSAFLEHGDQCGVADTYYQLGILAQDRRQYAEAEASYRKARAIFLEHDDQRGAADTYHQLGTVAQAQGRYAEAEGSYRKARAIFLDAGDQRGAADACHQLGLLAQAQGRYAEAEASYRTALDIKLECGDQHSAALTYHQLGMLAGEQLQYAHAEASYHQALEIFVESGDQDSAANTHHQIGIVARQQQRYAQAEASYRKALHIRRDSDPRAASSTAKQLGIVLARIGRHGEAARVRLYAATTWHRETGGWSPEHLQWLNRQRGRIEPDEFAALLAEEVPADLAQELTAAIEAAGEPQHAADC